ncbi:MAG TPA: hypothetical protein PK042_08855 [Usitatibacteraceae bacterium]|nr:hypothetical protein [Usitatibacteraceae bacterium]
MDYHCPLCKSDLGRSKLSRAVMARLEIECSQCGKPIRVNVHRAERIVVLANFAVILVLAGLAYWFHSRELVVVAFLAAMVGAASLPLVERVWLRTWPRYVTIDCRPLP